MLPVRSRRERDLLWPSLTRTWDSFSREFERFFDEFFGPNRELAYGSCNADVWEDDNHVYVEAELPGLSQKDVEVTVEGGVLTIRGEKKAEQKREGRDYYLQERRSGRFARSFRLPAAVNESNVSATLKDGLLTITLDKREEVKPRRIEVKAG